MAERERVTFGSGKVNLRGYLYAPDAAHSGRAPGVVLCHGFSGTMDRLTTHAARFAESRLAALIFDYRNFGESDGQQEDIRAAVAFIRSRPEVDGERSRCGATRSDVVTCSRSRPAILK